MLDVPAVTVALLITLLSVQQTVERATEAVPVVSKLRVMLPALAVLVNDTSLAAMVPVFVIFPEAVNCQVLPAVD